MTEHAIVNPPKRVTVRTNRTLRCTCGADMGTIWSREPGMVALSLPGEQTQEYLTVASALAAAEKRHANSVRRPWPEGTAIEFLS